MTDPGVPNQIKLWRTKAGLTQQQLADALEPATSKGTISQIESGTRGFSLPRLFDLARVLKARPGALLDGPTPLPTASELIAMIELAQREMEVGVSFEDYPRAVASSLHAQLQRYADSFANARAVKTETSPAPAEDVRPRQPTKKAARG
jgi:transcriptional regulator with XRE-family HTH domain